MPFDHFDVHRSQSGNDGGGNWSCTAEYQGRWEIDAVRGSNQ